MLIGACNPTLCPILGGAPTAGSMRSDSEAGPNSKASRRATRKARLEARLKADGIEKTKLADLEAVSDDGDVANP